MKKHLMITGANGFVAGSVIRAALSGWEVHALSRSQSPIQLPGLTWYCIPSYEDNVLHEIFHDIDPDAVVHAAAIADIDYSQAHPEEAWVVNANVTQHVAELCADHGIRLVFLSTDTVFDGKQGLYTENDVPNPVNLYGETKVRAEQFVRDARGNAAIARVALVMGLPVLAPGNSFVKRMMATLESGGNVTVPGNEVRSPIDVITLGRALVELAGNDFKGTLHLSGNDVLNRYDMMVRIAERLGFSNERIVVHDPSNIPGRAPRPRDVSLANAKACSILSTPMVGLDEGLEFVLAAAEARTA